jgi:hypothetical protein
MVTRSFIPHLEPIEGDITAQQVRDIRAHLRRMSDQKLSGDLSNDGKREGRVDTEHRGVTGTLVLTDVLDEKVVFPIFDLL